MEGEEMANEEEAEEMRPTYIMITGQACLDPNG